VPMNADDFDEENQATPIQKKLKLIETQIRRRCDGTLFLFYDGIAISASDSAKVKSGMTKLKSLLEE